MFYVAKLPSPVGDITLACGGGGESLVGLWIEGQKYHGGTIGEAMQENEDMPVFSAAKEWLKRYFAGESPAASELPVAPAGSSFRQRVWRILCGIPYGEVTTYGAIAREMAKEGEGVSSQAVGGAVGHNPISLVIPCHRVVGATGSLTGYAAGIEIKAKLLELEGADMSRLFVPNGIRAKK